jgi:hypothetical protein
MLVQSKKRSLYLLFFKFSYTQVFAILSLMHKMKWHLCYKGYAR